MSSRFAVLLAAAAVAIATTAACSQAPETPAPAPAAPTSAPASTAAPTPAPAPTATAIPSPTAAPTAAPAGASLSEMAKKAMGASEYSFDSTITVGEQTVIAHHAVKGKKMRQEMSAAGAETVLLIDGTAGTAYMLMPDEKMAIKMDFSQATEQVDDPGEWVDSLPPSTRQIGTETIDGKEAAVYEVTEGSNKGKFWLWTERGLPLKIEAEAPEGQVSVQFTNYQFGSVPDSLFELPPDTEVMEMPAGVPGVTPPATR